MGNKYSTPTKVLDEIPGSVPESLTTEKIDGYIEDASRYIDARLPNYTGFADIDETPATPAVIEKITRLIAAHDCMVYMGEMRGDAHAGADLRSIAVNMLDDLCPSDGGAPRAFIDPSEYDYTQAPSSETIRLTDSSRPKSIYRADIVRSRDALDDSEE